MTPENNLERAALYYVAERHQTGAWAWLEDKLRQEVLEEFMARYRGMKDGITLDVPYFYQRDSKTGHGERMCFSSSMAMAMDYLDPEVIEGDDDWYLHAVLRFGDTVSSSAQISAAECLGFNVVFKTDLNGEAIEAQLERGTPIPVGILHKGHIDRPSGGGHWVCIVGANDDSYVVHDPFGAMNLVYGGYEKAGPEDGMFVSYRKELFDQRWEVEGPNSGWGVIFR